MRVKTIHLRNFKRFTSLTIEEIPESAKVVVLVGPNGCGKSSLFDGFIRWQRYAAARERHADEQYFRKDTELPFQNERAVSIIVHGEVPITKNSLYVRTAYRNDPDFSSSQISSPRSPAEHPRFQRLIEDDKTVSDNYQRLVYETTTAVYDHKNDDKSVRTLREELIGSIRESMNSVFGDLFLNNITDPLGSERGSGAFHFQKGTTGSYHYKNLSGGEKAAFDLILDVHLKRRYFPAAIYCIDEVEAHLHTRVQGRLLLELAKIVPESSQLWVTTHSLGVLRTAQAIENESPGSVSIIDFDGVDLDAACVLGPTTLDRVSWDKMLSITLDDLSERVAPETVVVCEGSSVGSRRKDFDAEIYNRILGVRISGVVFVSGGSSNQVVSTGNSIRSILEKILPISNVIALADRDDKSEAEVRKWEAKSGIVLRERNLESYLFADDVIEALVDSAQKPELLQKALTAKRTALANSVARGNQSDDLKSAAGEIYIALKSLLGLRRRGDDTDAFMRDTLAPLVVPGLGTYEKLKSEIVTKIRRSAFASP